MPTPRGDEAHVVAAFCGWLTRQGWQVQTEVEHVDVLAERDGVRLLAEAKGITSAPGLDIDTAYGQLLRRMPDAVPERVRYALVVPEETTSAALRVPARVRELLGIDVFTVDQAGQVRQR
jgi:hypothetical protein